MPEELRFLEQLRVWMAAFPPSAADLAYQRRFAPLGLLEPASPYTDVDPQRGAALTAGLAAGRAAIEAHLQSGSPEVNGWQLTYHVFDYNLDHFEVGALDDPQWKLSDRAASYAWRALAARAGLWGNHGYEAAYAMTYEDAAGEPLSGAHRYTLRFPAPPPVDAFWSVTMYDLPEFFLVANPIGRYSIGDRTRGLVRGDDGALEIVLQHDEPPGRARARELAAHAGG